MSKLKPGDVVKFKPLTQQIGNGFIPTMRHLCGTTAVVVDVSGDSLRLKQFSAKGTTFWSYSPDMVTKVSKPKPQGIDLRGVPIGTRLRRKDGVVIEVQGVEKSGRYPITTNYGTYTFTGRYLYNDPGSLDIAEVLPPAKPKPKPKTPAKPKPKAIDLSGVQPGTPVRLRNGRVVEIEATASNTIYPVIAGERSYTYSGKYLTAEGVHPYDIVEVLPKPKKVEHEPGRNQLYRHKPSGELYITHVLPGGGHDEFRLICLDGLIWSEVSCFDGNDDDFEYVGPATSLLTVTQDKPSHKPKPKPTPKPKPLPIPMDAEVGDFVVLSTGEVCKIEVIYEAGGEDPRVHITDDSELGVVNMTTGKAWRGRNAVYVIGFTRAHDV